MEEVAYKDSDRMLTVFFINEVKKKSKKGIVKLVMVIPLLKAYSMNIVRTATEIVGGNEAFLSSYFETTYRLRRIAQGEVVSEISYRFCRHLWTGRVDHQETSG